MSADPRCPACLTTRACTVEGVVWETSLAPGSATTAGQCDCPCHAGVRYAEGQYAVITVEHGGSVQCPVVQRDSGAWQSGAHRYTDDVVTAVRLLDLGPALPATAQVHEYRLSLLPRSHRLWHTFAVSVRTRGEGTWLVQGPDRRWLNRDGRWESTSGPTDAFSLAQALRLADGVLPTVKVMGRTALDVLAEREVAS